MHAVTRRHHPWHGVLLVLSCALGACADQQDVVAYREALEAGARTPQDAGSDAQKPDTQCLPSVRFERDKLPEQLVLDLYMMDCKIPLKDFMNPNGGSQLSAADLSKLLNAKQLESLPGAPAALFCDSKRGGYYLEPWHMQQRLVMCPGDARRGSQRAHDRRDADVRVGVTGAAVALRGVRAGLAGSTHCLAHFVQAHEAGGTRLRAREASVALHRECHALAVGTRGGGVAVLIGRALVRLSALAGCAARDVRLALAHRAARAGAHQIGLTERAAQ